MEVSKPGKSVYLEVGVWFNEETGNIHLTAKNVDGFHTWIAGKPTSKKRWHPNLYNKLATVLREAGAPAPDLLRDSD